MSPSPRSSSMLFCHMRAIWKFGSTVHAVLDTAAVPVERTFGNAGAPTCVGCRGTFPRIDVPFWTIACSSMALIGWSYDRPLFPRNTVRRSSSSVHTKPARGCQLFQSFGNEREVGSTAFDEPSGGV